MGCKSSRTNDEVVVAVPFKSEQEVKRTDENFNKGNEDISEFSLRECSEILKAEVEVRRKPSNDKSIIGIIQEIS